MEEIKQTDESANNVEAKKEDKNLYGELRNKIAADREKFRTQLRDIKDKIEKNDRDREMLITLRDKLEGAIEASESYLRSVLPTNKA